MLKSHRERSGGVPAPGVGVPGAAGGHCSLRGRGLFALWGLWVLSAGLSAADRPGTVVFFPTQSSVDVLWKQIAQARERGDAPAFLEGISRATEILLQPGAGGVLDEGAGLARGFHEAYRDLLGTLQPDEIARLRSRVDPLISNLWDRARLRDEPDARRELRRIIARDLTFAEAVPECLAEELEERMERADFEGALRTARDLERRLQDEPRSAPEKEAGTGTPGGRPRMLLRARLLWAQAALALRDAASFRDASAGLSRALELEGANGPLDEKLLAMGRAILGARIDPARPVGSPIDLSPGRLSSFEARRPMPRGELARAPFRLGKLAWESRPAETRLRAFLEERARSSPLQTAPTPYFAASNGDLVLLVHSDRLVAHDVRKSRTVWQKDLPPEGDELSQPLVPIVAGRAAVLARGRVLSAFDLTDGAALWERSVTYDRASRKLRWQVPGEVHAPQEELLPPPEAEKAEGAAEEEKKEEPPREAGEPGPGEQEKEAGQEGKENGDRPQEAEAPPPDKPRPRRKRAPEGSNPKTAIRWSPPVALEDGLAVGATVRLGNEASHYLLRLDTTGEILWQTFLGSSQAPDLLGLGGSPSAPVLQGSRIIHLTNLGILACVDAADGTISWLRAYGGLGSRGRAEAIRLENRWHPNPVLILGAEVLIAPQDSADLAAYEVDSGQPSWSVHREDNAYLLGADEERIYLGGTGLMAVSARGKERGRTVWQTNSVTGGVPLRSAGRALLADQQILFPTREALLGFSLSEGKLLWQTLWELGSAGGNLLLVPAPDSEGAANERLLVSGPAGLQAYSSVEIEEALLRTLPADRTESILERAKFSLRNLDVERGLASLRAWEESAPPAPQPNSPLDHLHLDTAEIARNLGERWAVPAERLELLRYRVLLERVPARKVEAAIHLAVELEATGNLAAAAGTFHDALSYDNPETTYSPDGLVRVASADYLRDRIRSLRARASGQPDVFSQVDAAARDLLRRVQTKNANPAAYREVLRLYPFSPSAAEGYRDLARFFRDAQALEQAISALDGAIRDFPTGPEVVTWKLVAAALTRQAGKPFEARERYVDLLQHHAQSQVQGVDGARPGETVESFVRPFLSDPGLEAVASADPVPLKFPLRMSWRSPADLLAIKRTFLTPAGAAPERLRSTFMTQAEEVLELREVETGLPLWKVYLELIPGFQFDDPGLGRGFRIPRAGRRAFQGKYVIPADPAVGRDPLLILNDERNVLALDPVRGSVRWHLPVGAEKETRPAADEPFRVRLKEKIRGALATPEGVFVATTQGRLLNVGLSGLVTWEVKLPYSPAPQSPALLEGKLYLVGLPFQIRAHDPATGKEIEAPELKAALARPTEGIPQIALDLGDGRLILTSGGTVELLDLHRQQLAWGFKRPGAIENVFYYPEAPDEILVAYQSRANRWPSLLALRLSTGEQLWKFEKFKPGTASLSVARDRNRFYVVYGQEVWKLLALQVREGVGGEKSIVETFWPSELPLGSGFGVLPSRPVVSADSVFFPEAGNSIAVFDKWNGTPRAGQSALIGKFLVEKEDCTFSLRDGRLIILTDGGDCAFESVAAAKALGKGPLAPAREETPIEVVQGVDQGGLGPETPGAQVWPWERSSSAEMEALKLYLTNPGNADNTARLALQYFRSDDKDSAITLLSRALLSEEILDERSARNRFVLGYLLDGFKEERMKDFQPTIRSRRFVSPPAIDGELNDPWDVSTRIVLNTPRNLGTIPGPGNLRDWEGEEDLSAVLYTGWDETYFYFALDVSDDVLYPYDKESELWKGDCLLIGVDPTNDQGYRQHGNDQLMTLALTIPRRNLDKNKKPPKPGEEEEEEEEEDEAHRPEGLFSVKKKEDDSGAIYEVGLPWSSFQSRTATVSAEPGTTFGLSLLLTDDDTGQGATKTLSLNPCHLLPRSQKYSPVWRFIIPFFFPKVTLE